MPRVVVRSRRKSFVMEFAFRMAGLFAIFTFVWIAPEVRKQILAWIAAEQAAQITGMSYSTPLDTFPFLVNLVSGNRLDFLLLASVGAFILAYVLLLLLLSPRTNRGYPALPEERLRVDFAAAMPSNLVTEDARFIPVSQLSAREFEYEVARIIEATTGKTAQVVGGAGDNGIDIRVMDGRSLIGIVQCKRYSPHKALPPQYVRELSAVKQQSGVSIAYLVSSAYFSEQTRVEAARYGIRLMDGEQLEAIRRREYMKGIQQVRLDTTQKSAW